MNSPVPIKIIAAAIAFLIGAGVGAPRGDAARAAEHSAALLKWHASCHDYSSAPIILFIRVPMGFGPGIAVAGV